MKILIDIGHAAHVHLFKNFAWIMAKKGNEILFTVREKEYAASLIKGYGFNHVLLGEFHPTIFGKLKRTFYFSSKTKAVARDFKPDIFLSHGSISCAFTAASLGKPHLSFEDTGNLEQILWYYPFTRVILSPECLRLNLGSKHLKFRSYHEFAYLYPRYFTPQKEVLDLLKVKEGEKFVIVRFSAEAATHDFGYKGLPPEYKAKCVQEFGKLAKVFICSEKDSSLSLNSCAFNFPPEKMHDAFYYAALVYSEGAKSASEASLLGTPAIYVNFSGRDFIREEADRYKNIFNFKSSICEYEKSIQKGLELLKNPRTFQEKGRLRARIAADNIDLTALLVWFVENFPGSFVTLRNSPEYQFNFK